MIVFEDVFNGTELISDSYPTVSENETILEVEGKFVTVTEGDYDIGANPSAEGGDDGAGGEEARTVCDIVDAFKLQTYDLNKKAYMSYIKGYMKRVKAYLEENNPERVDGFMSGAQAFVKTVIGSFNDFEFYSNEDYDAEAMLVHCKYAEDGMTPHFFYFKDGLNGIKC